MEPHPPKKYFLFAMEPSPSRKDFFVYNFRRTTKQRTYQIKANKWDRFTGMIKLTMIMTAINIKKQF